MPSISRSTSARYAARSVKAPMSTAATTLFWRWRSGAGLAGQKAGPTSGLPTIRLVRVSNIMASPEPL